MVYLDKNPFIKRILCLAIFIAIVFIAFIARKYDYTRESAKFSDFTPFTLESAIMYSYSWDIAKTGHIPTYDSSLISSKEIPVPAQMSLTMECFLGYGYRLFNFFDENPNAYKITNSCYNINENFVSFIRNQIVLWISLSAGLTFLFLLALDCSLLYSFLGGILFAITPAAIMRATGQDLIKENFAIMPIILTCLLYFLYLKKPTILRIILLFLSVFLSITAWDMVQLFLSIWAVFEIIMALFRDAKESRYLYSWLVIYLPCLLGGIYDPYLNAHNFLYSPLVSILLPLLILVLCFRASSIKLRLLVVVIAGILLTLFWSFIFREHGYGANYSHFWSLILAKIEFLNVKPLNPLLLDFDARILWTPALNSANYSILWKTFHLLIPFFIISVLIYFSLNKIKKPTLKHGHGLYLCIFLALMFFVLFLFMVRFHSLTIPFICLAIFILWDKVIKSINNRWAKRVITCFLVFIVLFEAVAIFSYERLYNEDVKSQLQLIRYLNKYSVSDKVFLADFTLSSMIKAYCNAKIVLLPKFELKSERDNVENFINIMFHGKEKDLMNFCRTNHVDYFIYDQGMIGGDNREQFLDPYTSRYMAAAFTLNKLSPVYRFFYTPSQGQYFYPLDDQLDTRYLIFKVIYPQNMLNAIKLNRAGEKLLKKRDIKRAKNCFAEAVNEDPYYEKARYDYYTTHNNQWPLITLPKK